MTAFFSILQYYNKFSNMNPNLSLIPIDVKQKSLTVQLVLFCLLLSNAMTPHISIKNVKINSGIKLFSHIIQYSTRAKVHLKHTELFMKFKIVHNGLCKDISPDVIVIPSSTMDVSTIVKVTRRYNIPISIRSGGHSYICSNIKQGRSHLNKVRICVGLIVLLFDYLEYFNRWCSH